MIPPTAAEFSVERAVVFVATAGSTMRARSTFSASESRPSASERSCWMTLRRFSLIAIEELKFVISVSCSSAERLRSLTTSVELGPRQRRPAGPASPGRRCRARSAGSAGRSSARGRRRPARRSCSRSSPSRAVTGRARSPLTESSTSGFCPGVSRARPVGGSAAVEMLPRSWPRSGSRWRGRPCAAWPRRARPGRRWSGSCSRLGTETFPVGENGWPR